MSEIFDSLEVLCNNIANGGELEFTYNNRSYSITHSDQGIHFMEAYHDETEITYQNATQIGDYSIEGKSFKDLIHNIVVTFRCF